MLGSLTQSFPRVLLQAVPIAAKKAAHVGKSCESLAALLQLPHFDGEVLRKLARKKVKALPGAVLQRAHSCCSAGCSVDLILPSVNP